MWTVVAARQLQLCRSFNGQSPSIVLLSTPIDCRLAVSSSDDDDDALLVPLAVTVWPWYLLASLQPPTSCCCQTHAGCVQLKVTVTYSTRWRVWVWRGRRGRVAGRLAEVAAYCPHRNEMLQCASGTRLSQTSQTDGRGVPRVCFPWRGVNDIASLAPLPTVSLCFPLPLPVQSHRHLLGGDHGQ